MITQGDPCWVSEEASHVERERAQHRLFHLLRHVHVLHHDLLDHRHHIHRHILAVLKVIFSLKFIL